MGKRTIALGEVVEHPKISGDGFVLLNGRALHALAFARQPAERRKSGKGTCNPDAYTFPPSKNGE